MNITGKTAVVTGASIGIGRATAILLASNGVRVALVARTVSGLNETRRLIEEIGGVSDVYQADLRDENSIILLAENITRDYGRVDIIAHIAGVWHNESKVYAETPLVETPIEQLDEVFEVGITAPMKLTKLLLPNMIANKQGKIVCLSGTFANGGAGWLHYYVSKLALEHFTVGLSQELKTHGIQVNCVSPADTNTPALRKHYPEDAASGLEPEEVARMIGFLVSTEADNVTGQIIEIRKNTQL